MFDIIFLLLIPIAIVIVIAFCISLWNNKNYRSNNLEHRISRISNQKEEILDSNHKDYPIVELMNGNGSSTILTEYIDIYKNSISMDLDDTENL